ncbi:leucyl aminopeptidase family protein [Aquicella lusitana]|uniref:Leucyl aminopeptidase n=1 Tax=Aquicella lusitana TaxID=254246 RepID=A0A370GFW4_9COXI|nr:leucyl aminopeptidase family protein [Aquicella lusitana]RDI42682.1 leucyl aminopeptidase [Aquicella lusitana]VVC73463.1 Cytosol aminopeptidase [Aquicella lusitana]
MLACFTETNHQAVPIILVPVTDYPKWLAAQADAISNWLATTQFIAEAGAVRLIPDAAGRIARVVCCIDQPENIWCAGHLPFTLPEGVYVLENADAYYASYAIGWGLGAYQFTRYKNPKRQPAQLVLENKIAGPVRSIVESLYSVRDWINIPTDDMGPAELAGVAEKLANQYNAKLTQLIGEELLQHNYASIYTVGRASDDPPRLLDLRWGQPEHPKVTLVGKGVCFDTGGLDIKPSAYMLLMKKDMAGAAHVLGLARMIMEAKLPVRLRVLIPAVENVISGNAYRPGDIIKSRKGLTIEVGNTDAEGRVVLADALAEAADERPDLLIDIATLTGAARVALGTELPAVFSNHDAVVNEVIQEGEKQKDPVWRLPLFAQYREYLNSPIADINNNSTEPYAGAITAALFLKEFVPDDVPWLHFDMMAWNLRARPGRPQGGEAMALRALWGYLQKRFGK